MTAAASPGPDPTPAFSQGSGDPGRLDPRTPVRVGITLPQFTGDVASFLATARRAEAAGLDSVWVFDHLWPLAGGRGRPILESWTALAWLAVATKRVGIGTLVTRSTLRHPALLAKMAATVAGMAPGRVTVAVGSGDERSRAENAAFDFPYLSGADRLAQLEDTLNVLARYWGRSAVTYSGPHVRVDNLPPSPRPLRPTLWVGGRSAAAVELAGRLADGWNGWGGGPEEVTASVARLRAAARGRPVVPTWGGLAILAPTDAQARSRAAGWPRPDRKGDAGWPRPDRRSDEGWPRPDRRRVATGRAPEGYVVGGPATLAARLSELVGAGARHLVLTFPRAGEPGVIELLGERVRPALLAGDRPVV